MQDNATRIGINFSTLGKIKMFATTEWGVNLVGSETQFNLSPRDLETLVSLQTDINQVFTARLGFIGIDTGPFGRVAIGKQYAVHYDVAGYTTDRFNVFGGQGTFAYPAGTDGGVYGYRPCRPRGAVPKHFLKILEVGVRGSFVVGRQWGRRFAPIKILPGVKVGGAYTRTDWAPATQQLVRGLGGNADYVAVGTRIEWRTLELGFVYAHQHNGDVAFIPVPNAPNLFTPVAWSGPGVEFYSHLGLGKFGLIGGFTYQGPNVNDPLLNPDFKTQYLILGGEWFLVRKLPGSIRRAGSISAAQRQRESRVIMCSRSASVTTSRCASVTSRKQSAKVRLGESYRLSVLTEGRGVRSKDKRNRTWNRKGVWDCVFVIQTRDLRWKKVCYEEDSSEYRNRSSSD